MAKAVPVQIESSVTDVYSHPGGTLPARPTCGLAWGAGQQSGWRQLAKV